MLYHYTDFAAFDGIIRCAELRLNNILNMNDAAEMRLFMNGICNAVIEKLEKANSTPPVYRSEEERLAARKFFIRSCGGTLPERFGIC